MLQYTVSGAEVSFFLYMNNEQLKMNINNKIGINLTEEVQVLYYEKYKALLSGIKE